jgi:NTP pyrophosphatase (non-canonical NTP hydrolase)
MQNAAIGNRRFSNGLSDAQTERLALLSEEMGEAVHAVGKILRHGYASVHPDAPEVGNNRVRLIHELGDVLAAIQIMQGAKDFTELDLIQAKCNKLRRVGRYLHHQDDIG